MIDPKRPDFARHPGNAPSLYGYRPEANDAARPAVSIITPFFNTGEVFRETARSVLQQSLQNWEWLIVNDGSSDEDALRILDEFRRADERIRVIDQPNAGASEARNRGFREARADYVFQLDSDDVIEPTTLEKCAWFLASHPETAFVKGWTVGFGAQNYLWNKGFHLGAAFLDENLVTVTAMIRRSVHAQVHGYDCGIKGGLEDWDFWLRCAAAGYWGATIPEYLDWYRRRDTHNDRWESFATAGILEFRRNIPERYPELSPLEGPWAGAETSGTVHEGPIFDLPFENPLAKSSRRLLILLPWMHVGGADKFNLDLCDQMIARGWEISIVATLASDHPWESEFKRRTSDVFVLDRFLKVSDYHRFLDYLVASRGFDAVCVTNSQFGYQMLPYLRARHPHVAFLDYNHMEEEHWNGGGHPRWGCEFSPFLDAHGVASAHLKGWMQQHGADPDRVEVVHINVDPTLWRPSVETRNRVRDEFGLDADVPVFVYAARICEQKKPLLLAEVMRRLQEEGYDFRCLVAGDGPLYGELQRFVSRHRLEPRMHLLGVVDNARVRELMQSADVFVLTSQWEGIALSIYEAMSTGLAILGTDVGGQRELVTPEVGHLIDKGEDIAEIEQYVATLREWLKTPARLRAMGIAARERILAHFTLDRMGDGFENLIRLACRHKGRLHGLDEALAKHVVRRELDWCRIQAGAEATWNELERVRSDILRINAPPADPSPLFEDEEHVIGSARSAALAPKGLLERIAIAMDGQRWLSAVLRTPPIRRLGRRLLARGANGSVP